MNQSQLNEEEDLKVLALRIKHQNWQVRKRAYEVIQANIDSVSSLKEQFKINTEVFTALKLTGLLNNLTEEKHPILVLKGLDCVNTIIGINQSSIKYFNQLVSEGLQKFPQLTQQRKQILQKFMEILYYFKEDPNIAATLNSKLSLPNEKAVMWVIEVIGALQLTSLKKKLQELSRRHPKKDVRELSGQISSQLEDGGPSPKRQQEVSVKQMPRKREDQVSSRKEDPRKIVEILDKIHHYEQMIAKDQQKFTIDLLESMETIVSMSAPQLSNFSYFVQLMIEDNNQIISTNGVKILTILVQARSQLLPSSFPLLFIFRKFKMHKTHATNFNLFKLIQVLICSNRSNDLMAAILEGMNLGDNKANIKYGCHMSFLRIFCYFYNQPALFGKYCLGDFDNINEQIENRKAVEKIIGKCAQIFVREKDREYIPAIQKVKEVLGMSLASTTTEQRSKNLDSEVKSVSRSKGSISQHQPKTQILPKPIIPAKTPKSSSVAMLSPEGQLNKILQLTLGGKCSESSIGKGIDRCLKCVSACISEQVYDVFYFCEILQTFIGEYQSDERWDEIISIFLIDYLKTVAGIDIKESKRSSKLVQNGIQYLFKIAISKLSLGKELVYILDTLNQKLGVEVIVKCLYGVLVAEGETTKKKNKKYLNRWLEENVPEELVDNMYFEIREAVEKKKANKKETDEGPPSIISIPKQDVPTYRELKADSIDTFRGKREEPSKYQKTDKKDEKIDVSPLQQDEERQLVPLKQERRPERLQMFQNADISKIEQIEEAETDRLDERWEYFLNKKGIISNNQDQPFNSYALKVQTKSDHYSEEEKFDFSSHHEDSALKENGHQQGQNSGEAEPEQYFKKEEEASVDPPKENLQKIQFSQSEIQRYYEPHEQRQEEQGEQLKPAVDNEKFKYMYLDEQRITYMLHNSGKSFSHLRTLILLPFKKEPNKQAFLSELTYLIQSQQISKPEPYKSLLLLVITLFAEIRNDKSIIEPLQFLYQFMAQKCTNNEFLKIIIGLYHCVIEESEETDRKLLLTILAKSMVRIMPYVQNSLELLKDFQQFYQIGQLVYFEMYPEEYQQIRQVLEGSDNLEEIIAKACEEEGEGIMAIVEGWLDTGFKQLVKEHIQAFLVQVEDTDDS